MHVLLTWIGKFILFGARLRGGGSAFPGLIIEALDPHFIAKRVGALPDGVILVTGTNGKTTTAKMIRTVLRHTGKTVVANRAGSNMSRGVASALLEHSTWSGTLRGDVAVFEIDEAFVGDLAEKTQPKIVAVLNLQRDQLDRYGELDRAARLIGKGIEQADSAVLNSDDPLVADLVRYAPDESAVYFGGISELREQLPAEETLHQPSQRATRRHQPVLELQAVQPSSYGQKLLFRYQQKEEAVTTRFNGTYNAYNAAAAILVCVQAGLPMPQILDGLKTVEPAFGRTERLQVGDKNVQLLLVKNPAGFNQVIRTFLTRAGHPVLLAVNDHIADGRDVSWLWDVDFEFMPQPQPAIVTGTRAHDLAVRLKYSDIACQVERKEKRALRDFLACIPAGGTGYIVPTYTAMLTLRKQLAKQTDIQEVWEE